MPLVSARQHLENQKQKQAGHSSERAVSPWVHSPGAGITAGWRSAEPKSRNAISASTIGKGCAFVLSAAGEDEPPNSAHSGQGATNSAKWTWLLSRARVSRSVTRACRAHRTADDTRHKTAVDRHSHPQLCVFGRGESTPTPAGGRTTAAAALVPLLVVVRFDTPSTRILSRRSGGRANSAIFKVRDFACFCGSKYVPSM